MSTKKVISEGLTYDDVLLVPAYSEVLPNTVSIKSKFTRNIPLNTPIISAAMDTVTENRMAIAIAREGGIGVIHKNMSIAEQAKQVKKVKRSEAGMILEPVTISADQTVYDANLLMQEHKIGGIPVIDKDGVLIGIVTNRDLRFEKNSNKQISEIMTSKGLVTVKEGTSLKEAEVILQDNKVEKLPIVDDHFKLVGLITFRDITKVRENPEANKDEFGRLRVAAAIGVTEDCLERVEALVKEGVDAVVLDSAHGHSINIINKLKEIKAVYPKLEIVAGNIVTKQAALDLVAAGADGVKVGIGPGSICTTRVVAGVGYPQLSAVMQVAEALEGTGVPLIADGGVRYTGDIPKAIAAGADAVMLGSLLAGTREAPGEVILFNGRRFKSYRGMGSVEAMKHGSKDRYFQGDEDNSKKLVPEGIEGRVPYKGELYETMHQFIGGLRAGMGYCGAQTIAVQKTATFVKITASGITESHPHDVTITKEAPNYSR
ncbi:MAG: IMP dehydrogenase [Wenyingzhuangia sp.]|jgi:IMP dehydrogenase|uniref:IMP dehydrogenase n=1 Tax=Wenyingzhuangia sp. TaxID=1964193 RepID=UPI00321AA241